MVNDTPSYKSGSTKKPSESSSTVPNLLASNGQLKEFPYSSSKASDKSEFDHIMGRSAVANGQKTNTILPVFPKGIQSYSEFSIPMVYEKSATGKNYIYAGRDCHIYSQQISLWQTMLSHQRWTQQAMEQYQVLTGLITWEINHFQ